MQKIQMEPTKWKLLVGFLSTDKTRYALRCVHVTKEFIEATDGKGMVRITQDFTFEGTFEILKVEKTNKCAWTIILGEAHDLVYPNTNQVVPKPSKEMIQIPITDDTILAGVIIELFKFTGNGYSDILLEKLRVAENVWTAHKPKENAPLLLTHPGIMAILMPFSMC